MKICPRCERKMWVPVNCDQDCGCEKNFKLRVSESVRVGDKMIGKPAEICPIGTIGSTGVIGMTTGIVFSPGPFRRLQVKWHTGITQDIRTITRGDVDIFRPK